MPRSLVIAVVVILAAGTARAHQSSVKYADVTVDGTHATAKMTIAPTDVTTPLGLPDDARPTLAEAMATATLDKVASFIAGWVALKLPSGAACSPSIARAAPDADGKFIEVSWDVVCPAAIDELVVDFTAFFAVDQRHEAIVTVHAPNQDVEPIIVRTAEQIVTVRPGQATSLLGWIEHGMDHIYGGIDHIAFVLALLLVVVIQRPRAESIDSRPKHGNHPTVGTSDGWRVRSPRAAVKSTAVIITAFTVAHSASLIAASLGYIALPSRFVESMIAASIIYTAVEDIVRPDVRWRFVLTCAFGLVHGLGFASMLEELLPPTQVIVPLVTFNLGVEIGQLTIVVVAIPLLWAVANALGPERYRRYVIPVAASLLILVATKWLIERVFDVSTFTVLGI